jgi:hypothetical protein
LRDVSRICSLPAAASGQFSLPSRDPKPNQIATIAGEPARQSPKIISIILEMSLDGAQTFQ